MSPFIQSSPLLHYSGSVKVKATSREKEGGIVAFGELGVQYLQTWGTRDIKKGPVSGVLFSLSLVCLTTWSCVSLFCLQGEEGMIIKSLKVFK